MPGQAYRLKTIKVKESTYRIVKELAQRYGTPMHEVVDQAVQYYRSVVRQPRIKEDNNALEKAVWYIVKLAMSVGAFKENPSDENLARLEKTARQIAERLGVDTSSVMEEAYNYKKAVEASNDYYVNIAKANLNQAVKNVALEILEKAAQGKPSQESSA